MTLISMRKIIVIGEMKLKIIFLRKNGIRNILILLICLIKTTKEIKMEEMINCIFWKKMIIWIIVLKYLVRVKDKENKISILRK